MEGFARRFRLIQFDFRGEGYSTRGLPPGLSMDDFYGDVETVVERVGSEPLYIWAWYGPSHLAVRYAVNHPERVLALFLSTSAVSNAVGKPVLMSMLPREDWTLFLRAISPIGLSAEETARHVRALQACMTPEDWDATHRAGRSSDIGEYLPRLQTPTLVMHPRKWHAPPAEESMRFAALIPNARFQLIEGNYIYGQADQGLAAIDAFLSDLGHRPTGSDESELPHSAHGLTSREFDVLRLIAAGRSNQQIAGDLVISLSTVAKHVTSILTKTGAANRTEAALYARDHGLG
jgi:DNA-binding CsgD family transcriptional regulator/pimeloyl-ACP methyl ester carboxylesterase